MAEQNYIALSGGFDPIQIGHVRMIRDASKFGEVIIILNSDEWIIRKKEYCFMPFAERKEILEAMEHVDCVMPAQDNDDTVCATLNMLKDTIKYFGNGGDRWHSNTPEIEFCQNNKIIPLFGLGGYKVQSSSKLVQNVQKST